MDLLLVKKPEKQKTNELNSFYESNYWSPADKMNQLTKSESFVYQLLNLKN